MNLSGMKLQPGLFRQSEMTSWHDFTVGVITDILLPFHSQDLISNSPHCLPYSSYDVTVENFGIGSIDNPSRG